MATNGRGNGVTTKHRGFLLSLSVLALLHAGVAHAALAPRSAPANVEVNYQALEELRRTVQPPLAAPQPKRAASTASKTTTHWRRGPDGKRLPPQAEPQPVAAAPRVAPKPAQPKPAAPVREAATPAVTAMPQTPAKPAPQPAVAAPAPQPRTPLPPLPDTAPAKAAADLAVPPAPAAKSALPPVPELPKAAAKDAPPALPEVADYKAPGAPLVPLPPAPDAAKQPEQPRDDAITRLLDKEALPPAPQPDDKAAAAQAAAAQAKDKDTKDKGLFASLMSKSGGGEDAAKAPPPLAQPQEPATESLPDLPMIAGITTPAAKPVTPPAPESAAPEPAAPQPVAPQPVTSKSAPDVPSSLPEAAQKSALPPLPAAAAPESRTPPAIAGLPELPKGDLTPSARVEAPVTPPVAEVKAKAAPVPAAPESVAPSATAKEPAAKEAATAVAPALPPALPPLPGMPAPGAPAQIAALPPIPPLPGAPARDVAAAAPAIPPAAAPAATPATDAMAGRKPDIRIEFLPSEVKLPLSVEGQLKELASRVKQDGTIRLMVVGYSGTPSDSAEKGGIDATVAASKVSFARVNEIRDYLTAQGLSSDRITIRALGSKSTEGPADRVDIFLNQ